MVRLALAFAVASSAACGRIGFDETTSGNPPTTEFGCGLRDLAVGGHASCAIDGHGTLWCWGTVGGNDTPTAIALDAPAIAVGVGHDHACAILDSGKLRCLGMNDYGQLGRGDTTQSGTAVVPIGDESYVSVAMQRSATCAVTAAGALECWGDQMAGLDTVDHLQPTPVPVSGAGAFRRVFSSQVAMCADTVDNRRFCWGELVFQNGNGASTPTEVAITDTTGFGRYAACLLDAGNVRCLGDGGGGELGNGLLGGTNYAGTGTILSGVAALRGGARIQCAVGDAGEVWCWGENRTGELGTGDLTFRATPTRVAVPPAARVANGYGHTCAETTDGVYCWGGNANGELGRGGDSIDLAGSAIAGLPSSIAEVRVQTGSGGCARTTSGDVWCWGQNFGGLTGDPSRQSSPTATQIALPFAAAEIQLANSVACARSATQVACWGSNRYGGLGMTPSFTLQFSPLLVSLPSGPALSSLSGGEHGMCVLSGTTPYCWGTVDNAYTDPAPLPGAPATEQITKSFFDPVDGQQCLLDTAGAAWCHGDNGYGELGRGTVGGNDLTFAQVTGGRTYTQIATHLGYQALTCAIPAGGLSEVDCWGFYDGANVPVPTTYPLSAPPIALAGGGNMICALFADGTRDCIGDGSDGQLGDGTSSDAQTFAHVTAPATAISLDSDNACFVDAGVVRCVGDSRHGSLGAAPPGATPMRVALTCK